MASWGNLGISSLISGSIISGGSAMNYVSDSARRALGMGLAQFQDGQVHYFSKHRNILKRALIQRASQLAYGALRSYPRFLKYWEQKERDKHLMTQSDTSILNKQGQYYQLISEQKAVAEKKNYTDRIVGRVVYDYLELSLDSEGSFFNSKTGEIESNSNYGLATFVDLQPVVQVSSKNNVVLTTVQGRDYTRKEFISGGDYEISITGKITSKYADVYPESEVSKFLKLMQYKGVINCSNTILSQFNIDRMIVLNYTLAQSDCRNIQPYTISCVAIEPSEAVELKLADQENIEQSVLEVNKWIEIIRFGTQVVDPSSLLKLNRLWL